MKMSHEQRQLLLAITHEVTRASRSSRADKGQTIIGGQKRVGSGDTSVGVYPTLPQGKNHVVFNGNASHQRRHLRGRGYRLIGRSGKGWLWRAGYAVPADKKGRWTAVSRFLGDLASLSESFGLIAAGWHPDKRQWQSLAEMRAMVGHQDGRRWLDRCLVRIYTQEDYLTRWRQYFAMKMGFLSIPGGNNEEPVAVTPKQASMVIQSALVLDQWMKREGLTNEQLAVKLGKSAAWVSYQRSGKKPWSSRFEKELEAYRAGVKSRAVKENGG
jgi:hypothetical protein